MILRRDKNGKLQIVWSGKQLKDRRMLIRAGIPMVIMSRELRYLIDACIARNASLWDDFECYWMDFEQDWLPQVKEFAVKLGIRHWYLRDVKPSEPKWRSAYDDDE